MDVIARNRVMSYIVTFYNLMMQRYEMFVNKRTQNEELLSKCAMAI